MRNATLTRSLWGLVLVLGLLMLGGNRAAAQDGGFSVTIHSMECYTGVGPEIFEKCHIDIDSGTTYFENGDGTLTLTIPGEVLAGYLGAYIYCRDLVDDEVLFDGNYADTGGAVVFAVESGDEIVCDVYLITPAPEGNTGGGSGGDTGGYTDGDTGESTETTTGGYSSNDTGSGTGGTVSLPATGVGSTRIATAPWVLLLSLAVGALAASALLRQRHFQR